VLENTIPWWRRALKFALGGIRSGFGLFSRPEKPELKTETKSSERLEEESEEETALTEPSPQSEVVVAAEVLPAEPVTEPTLTVEPAILPEPPNATEVAPEPVPDAEAAPISPAAIGEAPSIGSIAAEIEAQAEPETEAIPLPAAEPEVVPTSEPEPVPEPTPEPATVIELAAPPAEPPTAVLPEPAAGPEPEPAAQPIPEAVDAAESEMEAELVIEPEAVETTEAVEDPAEEPVDAAESEIEIEPVVELEAADTPEAAENMPPEQVEVEESELTADALNEPAFEPEPVAAPVSASEPAQEPLQEPELAIAAETEAATEPVLPPPIEPPTVEQAALAPELSLAAEAEPVPEPVIGAAAVLPLVLTTQPTAEEEASAKAEEKTAAKLAARQKKLDESSEQSPFSVIVGQVYDGPLDLLLDLIRKQDIDIYDIPIAKITAQFLAYVNQLKASDVDVAGEFIYIASLLIHIKSKMLLPRETSGPEDAAEDPRRELVERLLEHERFKSAAQMLQQKQMLEAATWSNPGAREFKDDEATEPEIAADTVDLVRIFRDILERARKRPAFNVNEDSVTVGQMIQFLARRLTMEDKPVALRRLLSHTRSERALIAMFLALLELVRLQAILLRQDKQFSEIFIKKHTGFDSVMNDGLANARDDWR